MSIASSLVKNPQSACGRAPSRLLLVSARRPPRHTSSDRVTSIERLLEQYRTTNDRQFLERAIELWDEVEAGRKLQSETNQKRRIH
jgi:hypothetical protein